MEDSEILCLCNNVTWRAVKRAVTERGASTVEEVLKLTRLGKSCSMCISGAEPHIAQLIRELPQEKDY